MGEFFRRIYYLLNRRRLERELANDIEVHREMLGQDYQKDFGNTFRVREQSREAWGWNWLDHLAQDLRYGLRMLRKNPGFTAVAMITLALGIGGNTAVFSIVDAVLLRPLPYKDPHRLVVVWQAQPGRFGSSESFDSYRDFEEWRHSSRCFEQIEALTWARTGANLTWRGRPQRVLLIPATEGIFSLLGVAAAQG